MLTTVIYRTYPDGDVIALMPEIPASVTDPYLITCYQHIGQHGAADYILVVTETRPATDGEAAPLHHELETIGYEDLRPRQRRSPEMRRRALKTWRNAS